MTEEGEKLLMMFIRDSYSGSGRPTKKTAIATMKYVESNAELKRLVNIGDYKALLNYRAPQRG